MGKSIEELFEKLPENVRYLAITNTPPKVLKYKRESLRFALAGAFIWVDTPEGWAYWDKVFCSLT